jgi:hypothetical protein
VSTQTGAETLPGVSLELEWHATLAIDAAKTAAARENGRKPLGIREFGPSWGKTRAATMFR